MSSILCVGAHSDDIEIGCGGTVCKLAASDPTSRSTGWCFRPTGIAPERPARAPSASSRGPRTTRWKVASFRERYFPHLPELKEFFDELGARVQPDLVLTHHRHDAHQDHRVVAELTWNTFRDHLILEYEIPKYDGDLGRPNAFVRLDEDLARRKVRALLDGFPSQADRLLVQRGNVPGTAAAARCRGAIAERLRRGIPCAETPPRVSEYRSG